MVVGGGFGGLRAVRALRGAEVDTLLIDQANYHLFQPLLYQVATSALDLGDVAYPVRGVLRRFRHASFRLGTVTGADWGERALILADGGRVPFDFLVLAVGATTATFGVPGVDTHAYPLKTLHDALALRDHLLGQFEAADAVPRLIDGGALTVVVVGGGPTGVEMAGAVSELSTKVLSRDFPRLDVGRVRIVLVELEDEVLPPYHPRLRAYAADALRRRQVELRLSRGVAAVDADSVTLSSGERIAARTVVWTAGVRAHPLAEALALPLTSGGRVRVRPDLSVPGREGVWALGDVAANPGPDGEPLPQVAQVAIQGGEHVAQEIVRRLSGDPPRRFRYRDRGSMATIGARAAVAELPLGVRASGTVGWLLWAFLHLLYLVGFRNRASVLLNWVWHYLTWDSASRLIFGAPQTRGVSR